MLVKKTLFKAQNGFDERLAIAYGDLDLCLRLRQAGYFNVMVPNVKLYHFESASRGYEDTATKKARLIEESVYFRSRWESLLESDPFYHPNFSQERGDFSFIWE